MAMESFAVAVATRNAHTCVPTSALHSIQRTDCCCLLEPCSTAWERIADGALGSVPVRCAGFAVQRLQHVMALVQWGCGGQVWQALLEVVEVGVVGMAGSDSSLELRQEVRDGQVVHL
eukprot:CAMPEP_0196661560 /NCGR_PEP_ID=MMETSP1086-20130531/44869_1 /TAXON_ID=77921 /ORGANISM="Cyanoptyche  gloeocystis , Strain SAG4.97" /LENGTH=117 /DNA_ID=CAMNT_0041996513 /DNA_START=110 /DNA_END=460 /DNA_ORIENTATION=+